MDDREMQELFCFKITQEINWFKLGILNQKPEEIYAKAFEIDSMINLYELLLEMSQKMRAEQLKELVLFPRILAYLYDCWLKYEDSGMEEMTVFIGNCLSEMKGLKAA